MEVQAQIPVSLGNDMGTGNTVNIWSWVCSGMGMGSGLPYPHNTVPFPGMLGTRILVI